MNCQRCGAPLAPGNAFCGSCGSPAAVQQPQGHGAPPPPPPPQGGYPPQQYQQPQYQQPQYQPAQYQQPQYQQPQYPTQTYPQPQHAAAAAYGGAAVYQPVGAAGWVLTGYFFAFMGGLIGLGIGGWLWGAKVDGPNGQKVKRFKGSTRFHGFAIMVIGSINTALIMQQL